MMTADADGITDDADDPFWWLAFLIP